MADSAEESKVDRRVHIEGELKITEYQKSTKVLSLVKCPFCDYEFDDGERRWEHIFDEHDWDDVEEQIH